MPFVAAGHVDEAARRRRFIVELERCAQRLQRAGVVFEVDARRFLASSSLACNAVVATVDAGLSREPARSCRELPRRIPVKPLRHAALAPNPRPTRSLHRRRTPRRLAENGV